MSALARAAAPARASSDGAMHRAMARRIAATTTATSASSTACARRAGGAGDYYFATHRRSTTTTTTRAIERGRYAGDADAFRERPSTTARAAKQPPLLVKKTVSAGEVIEHDGDVVVVGDVARDGRIIARGDVFVWGSLLGEVEINVDGDDARDVSVHAMDMRPEVLRVGAASMRAPAHLLYAGAADERVKRNVPEVARVEKGELVISTDTLSGIDIDAVERQARARKGARRSAYLTGAYIGVAGALLLIAPTAVFSILFNTLDIAAAWIRVFGVLCLTFASYYIGTAYGDAKGSGAEAFYASTVVGRLFVFVALTSLVVFTGAQRGLLVLGIINALSALVMRAQLRASRLAYPSP